MLFGNKNVHFYFILCHNQVLSIKETEGGRERSNIGLITFNHQLILLLW